MAYQYFYNSSIKNVTLALLSMFKDIKCMQYVSGVATQDVIVPLTFNQPEKAAMALAQNYYHDSTGKEVNSRYYQQFPRMSLNLDSLEYDSNRTISSNSYVEWLAASLELNGQDANEIYTSIVPAPYNIGYTLAIRSTSLDYACQIVEQIAAYFSPNRVIRVKEFSFLNIERELNVTLTGITPAVTIDLAESDRRMVSIDLGLLVNAFMYRPVSSEKIIKLIESKYYTIDNISDLD